MKIFRLMTALPAAISLLASPVLWGDESETRKQIPEAEFDKPVALKNAQGRLMSRAYTYPGPALHDLDGDGRKELIVGSLTGLIFTFKQLEKNKPEKWGPPVTLQGAKGAMLKFNNW